MLSDWQYLVAQLLADGGFALAVFLISLGKRGVAISFFVTSADEGQVRIASARWKAPWTISDPISCFDLAWFGAEPHVARLEMWSG